MKKANEIDLIITGYEPYEVGECIIQMNDNVVGYIEENEESDINEYFLETKDGKKILVNDFKGTLIHLEFLFELKDLMKNIKDDNYFPIDGLFSYSNKKDGIDISNKKLNNILKEVFIKRGYGEE